MGKVKLQYSQSKNIKKLVEEHVDLVKAIVAKIWRNLPPYVDKDELISEGILGLIEAAKRYDPSMKTDFRVWAEIKIRGHIIDYLRKQDVLPRSTRSMIKKIGEVVRDLQSKLGRDPTDEEVSKALGIDKEEYEKIINQINITALISLDEVLFDPTSSSGRRIYEIIPDPNSSDPTEFAERENLRKIIESAMKELDEKEREVIKLYYFEQYRMKEIAKKLKVSESRISQIHTRALLKLREALENKIK